jgi:RNA polymerase sigma-70 factor (ECF subfamily)
MWLWGIATRVLADFRRASARADRALRRLGVISEPLDASTSDDLAAMVDLNPVRQAVRQAIERLPANLRGAVTLRVLDDRSYAEVAHELGCSEGAARVRVCRGLRRLEAELAAFDRRSPEDGP